ncbi:MAG: hypothetical protein HUU46_15790 [Candidatus Hydrogenedentes bacterium]|nr:hypothetical protein [Candidatus Hydrogenedentota bacterium]
MPYRAISVQAVRLAFWSLLVLAPALSAQEKYADSPDGVWLDLSHADIQSIPDKSDDLKTIVRPTAYRDVWLDEEALAGALSAAPLEVIGDHNFAAKSGATLWLPMPDGSNVEFAVVESPIMEPELAEEYPDIKTYSGRSLDGRDLFVRLDRTPKGFHAIVLGTSPVYIDPYRQEGVYVTYYASDYPADENALACAVEGSDDVDEAKGGGGLALHGDTLRNFRLAVACTGEYANFHGATTPETKGSAVAAIATTVNRVNGIYESELAIRLTLIGQNSQLVYIDPATDPFTGTSSDALIADSQSAINSTIVSTNYDIGHTLATTGGGLAELGCVCNDNKKAMGVTGIDTPIGDPFDIDYVAHEIGHQFGANHPFNSKKGKCKGQRVASRAYERGSGSTIMSYAGICPKPSGGDNIELHSDPFFHSESLREIQAFVAAKTTCQTSSATGNLGPIVDAGADYSIPKKTAFVLTATADDAEGDPVSYSWEERDLGPVQAITDPDNGKSPLFRCFPPKLDPWRMFPELLLVLGGNANYNDFYELLPSQSRTMKFWVVARDGRGGFGSDETQIRVVSTAGPFKVTYPNTPVVITGGAKKKVKWDVAGTNLSPISTANVRILLSIDGGVTFPTVLKGSTPNDGSEKVKFPKTGTLTARVKVEAVNNIFFDISDRDFGIDGGFSIIGTWNDSGSIQTAPSRYTFHDATTLTWCFNPPDYTNCPYVNYPYTFEQVDDSEHPWALTIPSSGVFYFEIIDNNTMNKYIRLGVYPDHFDVAAGTLTRQP